MPIPPRVSVVALVTAWTFLCAARKGAPGPITHAAT
jgi:hypothetical protein